MTTAVALSPVPILQFFNNLGQPNANGTLQIQVGGVNASVYSDSGGSTALPNPVPLNSRGEVSNAAGQSQQLFIPAAATYTFTLFDANGNQLNQATSVTPNANIVSVLQYGAVGDGVTVDTAAVNAALSSGKSVFLPAGYTFLVGALTLSASGVMVWGPGVLKRVGGSDFVLLKITGSNNILYGLYLDQSNAATTRNTQNNDAIQIAGSVSTAVNNRIECCTIAGGYGNGIAVMNSSRNKILANTISNIDSNGILVAMIQSLSTPACDDNLVEGNTVNGTNYQDGIFVTASAGSVATVNRLYRTKVVHNTVLNSSDSGIESGINTDGTIIAHNHVYNSAQEEILVRDAVNWSVLNNDVIGGSAKVSGADHIGVIPQLGVAFTATISNGSGGAGTSMVVSAVTTGANYQLLLPGQYISGSGVTAGTQIVSGPAAGGTGTYVVNFSQYVSASTSMTGTVRANGRVAKNTLTGQFQRSGIYSNHDGVTISKNKMEDTYTAQTITGSALVSEGIIAGGLYDVTVEDNEIRYLKTGVDANYGASSITLNRFNIRNNKIFGATTGINLYNLTLNNCVIEENKITQVVTVGINDSSANGLSASGQYSTVYNNTMSLAGWSGASPVANNSGLVWFKRSPAEQIYQMPYTNGTTQTLVAAAILEPATLTINNFTFSGLTQTQAEWAYCYTVPTSAGSGDGNGYVVTASSANIHATSGGGSGWSITGVSNSVVIKRIGTTTTAAAAGLIRVNVSPAFPSSYGSQ